MARLAGELFEILQLRTAVSLAERMDVVDVSDDNGRLPGELGRRQAAQQAAAHEPSVNVRHAGFDVLPELELLVALADLDGAQLASPVVDVLEQMAVDRAQVGKVEGTARYASAAAQDYEGSF